MKLLRLLVAVVSAGVMALLALVLTGWLYSAHDTSLAFALNQVAHGLPTGQTLQATDVQGSLRQGGRIGTLRWRQGDLSVEATDVTLSWSLAPLLQRQWRWQQLHIGQLHIDDQRAAQSSTQAAPPTSLQLPLALDIPFSVAHLTLSGSHNLTVEQISGHYVFDKQQHRITKGQAHISSANYEVSASLQAAAPMTLSVQLSGQVQTTVPQRQQPLTVHALAQLDGPLAQPGDTLSLHVSLRPELGMLARTASPALQAELSACIAPWQAQPLPQVSATWQALDLAALWPQAPHTQLSGTASVTPAGAGWRAQIDLRNAHPGPWNLQQLPLSTLSAQANYNNARWGIESLQASAAGGSVRLSGSLRDAVWQMQAELQHIDPAAIDTRLPAGPLSGPVSARQGNDGIDFDGQLRADQGKTKMPAPWLLQGIQARGVWAAPLLRLHEVHVEGQDASLQGAGSYHTITQAAQGHLALVLPGAHAELNGQLARAQGQGTLNVQMSDAAQTAEWLRRAGLPLVTPLQLDGNAELSARWQGGWQHQGRDLTLDALARVPRLNATFSAATPGQPTTTVQARDVQASLSGTLSSLQWQTRGSVLLDGRDLDWQAGGSGAQLDANHWQARVAQLTLRARDGIHPGAWTVNADAPQSTPLLLDWSSGGPHPTLRVGGGSVQISAPLPGLARITWQPMQWSPASPPTTVQRTLPALWRSQGRIEQVPLAWLELLDGQRLADLGLSSNMMLDGSWDGQRSDDLHVSLMLERSAGDLYLRVDSQQTSTLPALMHEARLQVNLDGAAVSASLRWDSERAGRALVAFSTRLTSAPGGWQWEPVAPVGASMQLQLPPIDAWSVLAPPGWRMRGTLDVDASLTGTRAQPDWSGTLRADNLALRSVADGIDFQRGTLRARLDGLQLTLQQFTLWGAGGAAGGQINVTGAAQWRPLDTTHTTLAQRLQVELSAQAQALRLSTRADRRLSVSGKLTARLADARLTLAGQLSADQAVITLPSQSAPALGKDVRVRRASAATRSAPTDPGRSLHIQPDVQIALDLGPDFLLRGRGLEARLVGKLQLRAQGSAAPTLTGSVRTARGTYQAYGQRLEIEQGVLRFTGAPDNPALDILAIRPKLPQRVGVQVLGTALSPVIRLYAEPELPEAEKLAWLVLGRSAAGRGGEAALLQQAALALLGSNGDGPGTRLSQALGLDEISVAGVADGAGAATVTLGKRLSDDFYVAYESGVAGTVGVFTIFYDLSRQLTLRARTGEQSALDLVWTLHYD